MNFENIMLSEGSQLQEDYILYGSSHLCERSSSENSRDRKQISSCLELGWGRGGAVSASGHRSFFFPKLLMRQVKKKRKLQPLMNK